MSATLESPNRLPWWMLAAAAAVAGCSGTADGGVGDLPSEPNANPYGAGSHISDVVGPATWHNLADQNSESCVGIPLAREVALSGLTVVAVDRFDETSEGAVGNVYAQDTPLSGAMPLPFSGLNIYDPGYTPPDLRVIENDVIDAFGILTEFVGPSAGNFPYCRTLPELGGSARFRFDRGGVAPVVIPVTDLASYEKARQWMGMVVTIENAQPAEPPRESKGRFTVSLNVGGGVLQSDVPSISNELFDLAGSGIVFDTNSSLSSVTGIVTYFYAVHIAPRSAADIVQ